MVAQQSLNLFVMVRIHVGQPFAWTEIFEILLADFRAIFRLLKGINVQGFKVRKILTPVASTPVAEIFSFGSPVFSALVFSAAIFCTPIPHEKANGSRPLRLKGPRTLRRV